MSLETIFESVDDLVADLRWEFFYHFVDKETEASTLLRNGIDNEEVRALEKQALRYVKGEDQCLKYLTDKISIKDLVAEFTKLNFHRYAEAISLAVQTTSENVKDDSSSSSSSMVPSSHAEINPMEVTRVAGLKRLHIEDEETPRKKFKEN